MMSDMEPNQPLHEHARQGYHGYDGPQRNAVPPLDEPYQQPNVGSFVDDNFVEALSQRIVGQLGQSTGGKVFTPGRRLPVGLRGAIAIISIVALIPLGIVLGLLQSFLGLVALGMVVFGIIVVNAIVNGAPLR